MQSLPHDTQPTADNRLHVAIIMDGNGRWAKNRGMPRSAGHEAGADTVDRIVEAAAELGIHTLTLFAFSSDNFRRPVDEVNRLFELFSDYLCGQVQRCIENGIRLRVIGRRDRLPPPLRANIEATEWATAKGTKMTLRLAVDYSAREAILAAAARCTADADASPARFTSMLGHHANGDEPAIPVDLLIRTGGEQRLSDFLLWECAYAELLFTNVMWPDFGRPDLEAALQEYQSRQRRFGAIPEALSA